MLNLLKEQLPSQQSGRTTGGVVKIGVRKSRKLARRVSQVVTFQKIKSNRKSKSVARNERYKQVRQFIGILKLINAKSRRGKREL